MSILDTFQKNFDTLKGEYIEYKDYHDTMVTIIPSILELLDSLFLEDNIKVLPNYSLLKEDYLDVIKRTLEPENYKEVKFEAELPDIYDAPRARREKAKKITKMKAKRVTTLPARILPPVRNLQKPYERGENIEGDNSTLHKALKMKIPTVNNETPKLDRALQAYANEGKRIYNYKSPLDCERDKDIKTIPVKVLIELPDETKAYLHNDGRITDLSKQEHQVGTVQGNGVVILNNSELGKVQLVDRDEGKFIPLTNNFGKVIS